MSSFGILCSHRKVGKEVHERGGWERQSCLGTICSLTRRPPKSFRQAPPSHRASNLWGRVVQDGLSPSLEVRRPSDKGVSSQAAVPRCMEDSLFTPGTWIHSTGSQAPRRGKEEPRNRSWSHWITKRLANTVTASFCCKLL